MSPLHMTHLPVSATAQLLVSVHQPGLGSRAEDSAACIDWQVQGCASPAFSTNNGQARSTERQLRPVPTSSQRHLPPVPWLSVLWSVGAGEEALLCIHFQEQVRQHAIPYAAGTVLHLRDMSGG